MTTTDILKLDFAYDRGSVLVISLKWIEKKMGKWKPLISFQVNFV